MSQAIDEAALKQLFLDARTHNKWQQKDVPDTLLHRLVNVLQMGPTSANCSPARFIFVKSKEAKERLRPLLSEGNRKKTIQAPICAIVGYDLEFYEQLPKLFPHTDARSWFVGQDERIKVTAFRNGTLQGAYLILIPGRCRASTTTAWTRHFSPAPASSRISCAISATAIGRA